MKRKWQRGWQREKTTTEIKPSSIDMAAVARKSGNWAKKVLAPFTVASLLLLPVPSGYASPAGGVVTAGNGSIAQTGNTTTVTQNTSKISMNWQSFNINANETVNFVQPSAAAIALNRIVGNSASNIYGQLNANGQVFLINPNGVLFAPGAQVNVGGLVASSLNLSDSDFLAGKYNFSGSIGSVVNQGTITAANKGYVALLGAQVSNQGVIIANQGTVALGAGSAVTFDLTGDGLLNLAVNGATLQALSENKNLIQANGGQVIMTARAADTLAGTVVNNTGIVQAQRINNVNGVIVLDGGTNGTVTVSGTLDASGAVTGQTGGTVKVLGNTVAVDNAAINASGDAGGGTVLIGGNWQGKGLEKNATNTTVGSNTVVRADALTSGNGGKVVVWADNSTKFGGSITAKGGASTGDGGSVETSGHNTLTVSDTARVNTLALKGKAGSWLLDPKDFTIRSSGGDMTGATIASNLKTTSVEIKSGNGSADGNGDIFVNDSIVVTGGSADTTLSLQAERNITFQSGAKVDASGNGSNKVNLVLWSDSDGNSEGGIALNNATIKTNGGNIWMGGGSTSSSTENGFAGIVVPTGYAWGTGTSTNKMTNGSGIIVYGQPGATTIDAGGGNIVMKGHGNSTGDTEDANTRSKGIDININGPSAGNTSVITTSGSGSITLDGIGGATSGSFSYGVNLHGATVSAVNGDITITGQGGGTGISSNQNHGVYLEDGNNTITSTNGTLSINGTAGLGSSAYGVYLAGGGNSIAAGAGNLSITGIAGVANSGYGIISDSPTDTISAPNGKLDLTSRGKLDVGGKVLASTANLVARSSDDNTDYAISADNTLNDFAGKVTLKGKSAYLKDKNSFLLGNSELSDYLYVRALGGDIVVDGAVAKNRGSAATAFLIASGNITMAHGSSIDATGGSNALNVSLFSDSNADGGAIFLDYGSTIKSNGGTVTLAGGDTNGTGYAKGVDGSANYSNGITILGANIESGGGNIVMRGKGATTYATSDAGIDSAMGINIGTSKNALSTPTLIDSGAGTITFTAVSGANITTDYGGGTGLSYHAMEVGSNTGAQAAADITIKSSSTSDTAITINADASGLTATTDSYSRLQGNGFQIWNGAAAGRDVVIAATKGGIVINGTASQSANVKNEGKGVRLGGNGNGLVAVVAAGPIMITGKGNENFTGASTERSDILLGNSKLGFAAGSDVTSSSGNITLTGDTLSVDSASRIQSSGALSIKPRTNGTSVGISGGAGTLSLPAAYFASNFANGFSQITIGSANTGKITVGGATTLNDATALVSGDDITLNGALNASGQTVTLTGGSGKTVSGSGNITAGSLLLNGTGSSYALNTASGNNVGTLAANGSADVKFSNNGPLTIGTVGTVSGISATGVVDVRTAFDDMTVSKDIVTTNATSDALVLVAGANTAAGTSTGGDIKVNGTATVRTGINGRATLYSGSISGSTGMVGIVGTGTGNFRYNSSKTSANYTTPLGTTGIYGIFREQPTITVTANNAVKTYDGLAYSGGNGVRVSGLVNGDSSSILSGTLSYSGTSQGAVAANSYSIIPGGYSNGFGYALSRANGILTINPSAQQQRAASPQYNGALYAADKSNANNKPNLVAAQTTAAVGAENVVVQNPVGVNTLSIASADKSLLNFTVNQTSQALEVIPSQGSSAGFPQATTVLNVVSVGINGQLQAVGAYQMISGNAGLRLTETSQPSAAPSSVPTDSNAKEVSVNLSSTIGEAGKYSIRFIDNALVIRALNDEGKKAIAQTGESPRSIVAVGLITAMEKLGVNPERIRTVVMYKD